MESKSHKALIKLMAGPFALEYFLSFLVCLNQFCEKEDITSLWRMVEIRKTRIASKQLVKNIYLQDFACSLLIFSSNPNYLPIKGSIMNEIYIFCIVNSKLYMLLHSVHIVLYSAFLLNYKAFFFE
eukprot:TRINITY_DN803_c0_g1_i2.p4 TRINITY_DN803_c0_g1~~TRINITY_DN803_c0_g1_i2.p4  ORF type:complete len:126 (-),score=2.38 TRINITY_DN803_c0_g1_i2:473-850(-)